MFSIIIFIALAILLGQGKDRRRSDISKIIIPLLVFGGIFALVEHPILSFFAIFAVTFLIVFGIIKLTTSGPKWDQQAWEQKVSEQKKNVNPYSKTVNTVKERQQNQSYAQGGQTGTPGHGGVGGQGGAGGHAGAAGAAGYAAGRQQQQAKQTQQQPKPMKGDRLPKAPTKRKKIIQNFNNKYNLNLTEEQIQSIANSSYMSEIWHNEVDAMNQKYNSVYEWFPGYTQWLRTYMYVFHVQEITSDIRQQEKIVIKTFEEIFQYADSLEGFTVAEKIEKVNSKYMTAFDDATFMIAYRFLEAKGMHHDLEGPELLKDENEIDELLEKYKTMPSEGE